MHLVINHGVYELLSLLDERVQNLLGQLNLHYQYHGNIQSSSLFFLKEVLVIAVPELRLRIVKT